MESCVWLEEYLKTWNPRGIQFIISHSQDFMNGVCTNIVNLHMKKLQYFTGNYDQYVITRAEKEEHQMKHFKFQQDKIDHMKNYIARFGHGSAKLARQAKSREKAMARMERAGLTQMVQTDRRINFSFKPAEELSPPVMVFQNVSFGYPGCELLYKQLELYAFRLSPITPWQAADLRQRHRPRVASCHCGPERSGQDHASAHDAG